MGCARGMPRGRERYFACKTVDARLKTCSQLVSLAPGDKVKGTIPSLGGIKRPSTLFNTRVRTGGGTCRNLLYKPPFLLLYVSLLLCFVCFCSP